MDKFEPKTVYHYCSMQAFYSIFRSKEFWINDIFKMITPGAIGQLDQKVSAMATENECAHDGIECS